MPSWQNEIYLWRMATKARMTLWLTKVFAVPVGRYIKIQTALRTHQIAGFVSVHSEKKINTPYTSCKVIFPSPEEVRNNTSNEQNFRPYYMLNHGTRDLLFHYCFQFLVFNFSVRIPSALSVHCIDRIRWCTRKTKRTWTKPLKCSLSSLLHKSSLLWLSNLKNRKKKSKFGFFSAANMLLRIFVMF